MHSCVCPARNNKEHITSDSSVSKEKFWFLDWTVDGVMQQKQMTPQAYQGNPYTTCCNAKKPQACTPVNAKNDSVMCKHIKPKSTFLPYTLLAQNISKKPS